MSWDVTRRQIRSLETRLDAALNQYSRLAADIARAGPSSSSGTAWPGLEVEEGRKGVQEDEQLEDGIERSLAEVREK